MKRIPNIKKGCSAKTKKNTLCKNDVKWFYYCKFHWKERLLSKKAIWTYTIGAIFFLGNIGGFYQDFFIPVKEDISEKINPPDYWFCEQDRNIRGLIFPNSILPYGSNLEVHLGQDRNGVFTQSSSNNGELHCFIHPSMLGFKEDCPLKFRIDQFNKLSITADLYDAKGCLAGRIQENTFVLNHNCEFTWNKDDNAFEVIDSNFDVVFSIEFRQPNILIVQGVFYNDELRIFIYDGHISPSKKNELNTFKNKIKPLFQYISKDWFGKRVKI